MSGRRVELAPIGLALMVVAVIVAVAAVLVFTYDDNGAPRGERCDPVHDTVKTVDGMRLVCALDYSGSDYRWRR